jgi:uncharacterized membrane protein
MLILAFYFQYFGWILFIFIIVFIGISHPPPLNDISKLDTKRWATGAVVFLIFAGCFTPVPLYPAEPVHDGTFDVSPDTINIGPNETGNFTVSVRNLGNMEERYTLRIDLEQDFYDQGWLAAYNLTKNKTRKHPKVQPGKHKNVTFLVHSPPDVVAGDTIHVNITLKWKDEGGKAHFHHGSVTIIIGLLKLEVADSNLELVPGRSAPQNFTTMYLDRQNRTLTMEADLPDGWDIEFSQSVFMFTNVSGYEANATYRLIVPRTEPMHTKNVTLRLVSWARGETFYERTVRVKVLQMFDITLEVDRDELFIEPGGNGTVNITVTNIGNGRDQVEIWVPPVTNLSVDPEALDLVLDPGAARTYEMTVSPDVAKEMEKNIWVKARSKGDPGVLVEVGLDVYVTA